MQRDGKLSPQLQGRAVNRDQDKMTQMLHVTNRQSSFYKEVPRMTGKSGLNKEQTGKSQQRISNDKKKKKDLGRNPRAANTSTKENFTGQAR